MPAQISPILAVTDGSAAIAFYKAGFGAEVLWQLGAGADIVAGLAIDGAPFFLAFEASAYGTRGHDKGTFWIASPYLCARACL